MGETSAGASVAESANGEEVRSISFEFEEFMAARAGESIDTARARMESCGRKEFRFSVLENKGSDRGFSAADGFLEFTPTRKGNRGKSSSKMAAKPVVLTSRSQIPAIERRSAASSWTEEVFGV